MQVQLHYLKMEMKIVDSFGFVDDNLVFLNGDEYAYTAGAKIIVRPFKTSDEKKNKYLE